MAFGEKEQKGAIMLEKSSRKLTTKVEAHTEKGMASKSNLPEWLGMPFDTILWLLPKATYCLDW